LTLSLRMAHERLDDLRVQRPPMPSGRVAERVQRLRRKVAHMQVRHESHGIDLIPQCSTLRKMSILDPATAG